MGDFIVEAEVNTIVESGTYWFYFLPELESLDSAWNWEIETATSGSPAQFRDQTGLTTFDPACSNRAPLADCVGIPAGYQPSLRFDIYGVVGGSDCN
jgi:hypothetical protein